MPIYAYRGYDNRGKSVNGTREAENPRAVKQLLRREGVFLTDFKEQESDSRLQRKLSARAVFLVYTSDRGRLVLHILKMDFRKESLCTQP